MDKKILNKLKVGEKVVKIEECSFNNTVCYKAIIYSCIYKILWIPKISTYTIPFYFATKELAIEFLQYYDEFEWEFIDACENSKWMESYQLKLLNYTNRHEYYMLDVSGKKHLMYLGIWGGLVNSYARYNIESSCTMSYKEMFNKEEKIIDGNNMNITNEYIYKMTKI